MKLSNQLELNQSWTWAKSNQQFKFDAALTSTGSDYMQTVRHSSIAIERVVWSVKVSLLREIS